MVLGPAHWEHWQPAGSLAAAALEASSRVLKDGRILWAKVAGPAAATVASAARIGWRLIGGNSWESDDGTSIDMLLDPPIAVIQAARQSVRRWRIRNIGALLPDLIPLDADITIHRQRNGEASNGWQTTLVDFTDVVDGLLHVRRGRTCPTFSAWEPKHKAYLRSAIGGGQWTQSRLAAVPGWADDNRCQLCMDAIGTPAHRLSCPAICPAGGWQPPPAECQRLMQEISTERLDILSTRGLFVLKVHAPRRAAEGSFAWILSPPEVLPADAVWYIDGSLFDEAWKYARRTGFGVVVVGTDGTLLGFGNGVPPPWVHDAAGAELWALCAVAMMNPSLPHIVTDCKSIVDALQGPYASTVRPMKALARTWSIVGLALDYDFEKARSMVRWMPSHVSALAIGRVPDSSGVPITPIMWRANRLVDVLAKAAATPHRLPAWVTEAVLAAGRLVQHHAARLGTVTWAANNHEVLSVSAGGDTVRTIVRDSTAVRPMRKARRAAAAKALPVTETSQELVLPAAHGNGAERRPRPAHRSAYTAQACARYRKRAASMATASLRQQQEEEGQVAGWLANLELRPRVGPDAAVRLELLKKRVRDRL